MNSNSVNSPLRKSSSAVWQAQHPVWALGFRPFYLLSAAFAALSLPLWIAHYLGWLSSWPQVNAAWHMHEMVFGMAIAVIIGFLYTAGRNWTGLATPSKRHLALLAGCWLMGRLAMLLATPTWAAVLDLAFLPLAAWPLYRVLQQSGNMRNMFLIVLLTLLSLANAVFHAGVLGLIALAPATTVHAAILLIVIMESIIGARVIPMFTQNGVPGVLAIVYPWLNRSAVAALLLASFAWVAAAPAPLLALLCAGAACIVMARLALWQPHRTLGTPIVWILQISYAWIPLGFFLLALAALDLIPASAAWHAFTVGSLAGLILGMMTRTTLGHTGRPLKTGRVELALYLLIQTAALARVAASLLTPALYQASLVLAMFCWCAAFILFLFAYTPYLLGVRVDGREG
ncbi:MAG: NnrS family protein [Burkholderiales bacterium]|nr:NnrS family protein [Burkholderiales bacterium]